MKRTDTGEAHPLHALTKPTLLPSNALKGAELENFWRGHVEQYQRSGQSKAAYVRSQGLIAHRFKYWSGKLTSSDNAMKRNKTQSRANGFIPLHLAVPEQTPPSCSASDAEVVATLQFPKGHHLQLHTLDALQLCVGLWR